MSYINAQMEKFELRQKPSEVADFGQGNAFSCF